MVIAVTFALPAESSEFLRRLSNKSRADRNGVRIIRGNLDDRDIEILHTGVGEKVCRERLGRFLSATGRIRRGEQDQQFEILISAGFAIRIGDLLTVPALIDSSEERNNMAREVGAAAVDMETKFIARACAAHALPLLSFRVISDTPRNLFPAPPDVLFDIERQQTQIVKLAKYFLSHPHRAPHLIQFARRIAHARKILASALVALIKEL